MSHRNRVPVIVTLGFVIGLTALASGCDECNENASCAIITRLFVEGPDGKPVTHFSATVDGYSVTCRMGTEVAGFGSDDEGMLDCFAEGVIAWDWYDEEAQVTVSSLDGDGARFSGEVRNTWVPAPEDSCGECPYQVATVVLEP